ncbi:MAG: histidine kinase, partial [Lachnospiraceae bacterium]|nr:histidine kinase [Lachnospiraceae bacterium]
TKGSMPYARTLVGIYGYCIRPVIIVLFCYLININRKYLAAWILVAVNAIINLTAIWSGICFSITPDNQFVRGPLGYTCHITSAILLVYLSWLALSEFDFSSKKDTVFPLIIALMVAASVIADSFVDYRKFPATFLTVAVVSGSLFYYIWLHLQFFREHEKDLMAELRIKAIISQMQPHFIYNSLSVISSYLDEPDMAEEAMEHFAGFLRGNIDLLNTDECIRVQKELNTVDNYLYLVGKRFGDKIVVEKDIADSNFFLPPFTIQALVENAITHGIRKNRGGKGTLWLKIYSTKEAHIIEVSDDGVGFDVSSLNDWYEAGEGDESHIGLSSAKERLRFMSKGTLSIESEKGKGTKAVVSIPKLQDTVSKNPRVKTRNS